MGTFREDCDRAAALLEKFEHLGQPELQYELNLPEQRFYRVRNFLVEKQGCIDLIRDEIHFGRRKPGQDSGLCDSHNRCLVTSREYARLKEKKENSFRLRGALRGGS